MNDFTKEQVVAEVVSARSQLAQGCSIPESSIVGFRQPYLQSSPTVREVRMVLGYMGGWVWGGAEHWQNIPSQYAPRPPCCPVLTIPLSPDPPHPPTQPPTAMNATAGAARSWFPVRQHPAGGGARLSGQRHGRPGVALHHAGRHSPERGLVRGWVAVLDVW